MLRFFSDCPENLFALTLHAIICRIKEVDAAVNRHLDQFIGLGLANGADALEEPSAVPECHGSEAKFRNQQTRISEGCVFHGVFLILRVRSFRGRKASVVGMGACPRSRRYTPSLTGYGDLAIK